MASNPAGTQHKNCRAARQRYYYYYYYYYGLKADACGSVFLFGWMQSVKEVEETWRGLKFNVQQFTKGTSDRGFILGAIDEVMQTLDDNAMQLQGILSSRFIGPFLNAVQNWEKALSHISEVLEVRDIFAMIYVNKVCLHFLPDCSKFGLRLWIQFWRHSV